MYFVISYLTGSSRGLHGDAKYVKGRPYDLSKPVTFNQPWSSEEQVNRSISSVGALFGSAITRFVQYGHENHKKSWNLKMHFPGLEKSWMLGKMAVVMEESCNFIFWSKYSMLFENWKHSPCHCAKICPPKGWVFSIFLVMETQIGHGKVIRFYCLIPV